MAVNLRTSPTRDLSPVGLRIRRVRAQAELAAFASMDDDADELRFYEMTSASLLTDTTPRCLYVGYMDDVPVATAELTVAGGVAGLYNISTVERYRRRGIGTAMTRKLVIDAREAGLRTAVLQA